MPEHPITPPMTEAMALRLRATLGNPEWMKTNHESVMQALPAAWTSAADGNFLLRFGFAIKCLGVEWREMSEVVLALAWLQKLGWCEARVDPHAAPASIRQLIIRRAGAAR